jgi:hypothetical protein
MLVFPIVDGTKEKPVGVLQIINKIGCSFDAHDQDVLRSVVPTAARIIATDPMFYKSERAEQTEADKAFASRASLRRERSRRPSVQAVEEGGEEEEEEEEDGLEEEEEEEERT